MTHLDQVNVIFWILPPYAESERWRRGEGNTVKLNGSRKVRIHANVTTLAKMSDSYCDIFGLDVSGK
jgi:hypothetical protein